MLAHIISQTRQISLVAAFAVTAFSSMASAQTYSSEQRRLCTGDAFRLCMSAIPNVEEVTMCMRRQKASLSAGCKAVFDRPVMTTASTEKAPSQD